MKKLVWINVQSLHKCPCPSVLHMHDQYWIDGKTINLNMCRNIHPQSLQPGYMLVNGWLDQENSHCINALFENIVSQRSRSHFKERLYKTHNVQYKTH